MTRSDSVWVLIEREYERMKGSAVTNQERDDDPVCVCGVARSEHAGLGCPEGFQRPQDWDVERAFIASLDDWEYERIYGDD